jgi:hypothetical protein
MNCAYSCADKKFPLWRGFYRVVSFARRAECGAGLLPSGLRLNRSFCRASTILAVSWYLLIPPYAGNHGLDTTAPMSEWTKAGAYQSQQECRQAQQAFTTVMSQPRRAMERAPAQALLAIERSQCLSADDFRLEAGQPLPAP